MDGGMYGGGLTPEQMQALQEYAANQGAFTEQDRAIQQQLQMADALRNRRMDPHTTGKGAMLGGMGYVLNQYLGNRDVAAAQARDAAFQQARIKALQDLVAKGRMQPQPMMPSPYGMPDPGAGGD